jgi:hypothetical protein
MTARLIDEFVLPALAPEVGLDLRLRGLPDIDYRLALEQRGGQKISAGHRHIPPSLRRRPASAGSPGVRALWRARTGSSREAESNRIESNAMLTCCGAVCDDSEVVGTGFSGLITLLLPDDVGIVRGACAETAFNELVMQVIVAARTDH